MYIQLHKKARTTPAIRAELRESTLSERKLAAKYGITRSTVRKWKQREDVHDRSHRPHHLHTTLSAAQEAIVVELRRLLLLPLDDLLVVTREFINPAVSRSGLDRCLRRHGVSNLKDLIPKEEQARPAKTFKHYVPGFVHIDVKYLPQMPDEQQRRYLFVAIDRASRWVYLELLPDKSARTAQGFLKRLIDKAPFKIEKVLTDNGKAFTDRFAATGQPHPERPTPLRPGLPSSRHRAPLDPPPPSPDQWHGRTLQWAHQRGAGHHPFSLRRASGTNPHALCCPL